jgi:integrase/recombinase XerD
VDAKILPVQACHHLAAVLGGGWFLPPCVIDSVLEHSPAEHVRRPPHIPAESPTLGFTHPEFEALLTAARGSANR